LINYSENCFVQKFKTGKNFWWYGVEFVFLSFVEKPQCNQVVLCLSVSCLPNKKTEQEVFVFGKKSFVFILFIFSLTALIFRQGARWTSNQTFFFQLLQQVYLSTCVSRETKLFIYFYYQSFSSFFLLSFFLWILFSYLHFHSNEFNFSQ
jgi:hypothetical protein